MKIPSPIQLVAVIAFFPLVPLIAEGEKGGEEDKAEPEKIPHRDEYKEVDDEALKKQLSPLQFYVTKKDGTEPPFENPYWDNKRDGIYVDRISGKPLFSSTHKFKSGTGWPSFYTFIDKEEIVEKVDYKLGVPRMEVRSKSGDAHLGHVFEDGPEPTGLRYCMNSAALLFIPKEKLEEKGYGEYLKLFADEAAEPKAEPKVEPKEQPKEAEKE